MFTIDEEQQKKLDAWMATKPVSKATIGEQYEYCFIPTSLGVIVRVKCLITKTEIDLTDYDSW